MAPNLAEVHQAALKLIERHGDRALEMAGEIQKITKKPEFAAAVTAEVERLMNSTHH